MLDFQPLLPNSQKELALKQVKEFSQNFIVQLREYFISNEIKYTMMSYSKPEEIKIGVYEELIVSAEPGIHVDVAIHPYGIMVIPLYNLSRFSNYEAKLTPKQQRKYFRDLDLEVIRLYKFFKKFQIDNSEFDILWQWNSIRLCLSCPFKDGARPEYTSTPSVQYILHSIVEPLDIISNYNSKD